MNTMYMKILKIFKDTLVMYPNCDLDLIQLSIKSEIDSLKQSEKSFILPVYRSVMSLKQNSFLDFSGHLRQVLMYIGDSLEISKELFDVLSVCGNDFRFSFSSAPYSVSCDPVIMRGTPGIESTFHLSIRKQTRRSFGDGRLKRSMNYDEYNSLSQKMLLSLLSKIEPGQTLLACLPTGAGKSLSWQLPVVSKTFHGLTIVIVPTIALAIDHEKSSQPYFNDELFTSSRPRAYYGDLDKKQKSEIFTEIENATLPLLYISPEALLHEDFKQRILETARNDGVNTIYIDEAHLVVSWGMKFRPEFQLLPVFINRINEISTRKIRTILLSATFTVEETNILKALFSRNDFIEYRADELRPELEFYIKRYQRSDARKSDVMKLLCQTPRPIIVYTLNPDQAEDYMKMAHTYGFKNVAVFSGLTNDTLRKDIIQDWDDNRIDIVFATSAFGMGVDKSDIRTIINVYKSESIGRFYQEVGRSGRDGLSSLSYLLTNETEDQPGVNNLVKSTVLTSENIVKRWKKLYLSCKRISPDEVWLDTSIKPDHLEASITGERNADWNKFVIMFMNRFGLISLEDMVIKNGYYLVRVRLLQIERLENFSELETYIEPFRSIERERISVAVKNMDTLINKVNQQCISTFLTMEFPRANAVCSGCPYCRKEKLYPFFQESTPDLIGWNESNRDFKPVGNLGYFLLANRSIQLVYDNTDEVEAVLSRLVLEGVSVLLLPEKYQTSLLLSKLSENDGYEYVILTTEEYKKLTPELVSGVMTLVYDGSQSQAIELEMIAHEFLTRDLGNKAIHLQKGDLYSPLRHKPFSEIVEQSLHYKNIE